jgi:hypothetical protein
MDRKRSSLFLTLVACGALSLGLIGCGSGGGYSKPANPMPGPYTPPAGSSGAASSLRTPVNNPSVPGASNVASTQQAGR